MLVHAARLTLAPILFAQARRLRAVALQLPEPEGPRSGVEGDGALRLRLLVAGDSSAAGVGAPTQDQALALPLARDLARRLNGRIAWQLVARTGVNSEDLLALLRTQPVTAADVAVIVVGVNDVTSEMPLRRALEWRGAIADWLCTEVGVRDCIFTSMPEMQHFPLIPQPLAWYAGLHARRNNRAQARWARKRGDVRHLDLQGVTRAEWMAPDGYHPAPALYAEVARRIGARIAAHAARGPQWPSVPDTRSQP